MSAKSIATFKHGPVRQHGAALMIMLIIMIIGVATIFVRSLNSSALQISRDKVTADALAQAKEALIGRAVADLISPGSLPCPDLVTNISGTNIPNDGVADLFSGSDCPSYIGRLPWKTLGLPDLRDGSGERLWYALSPNFRDYVTLNPINSNRVGTLVVYDNNGNLLTPSGFEAVAIVFAPGDVVASQQRDTANQNSPQNYLESYTFPSPISVTGDNTNQNGPFIQGIVKDASGVTKINDRLIIIRRRDIIPTVEMRVARELTKAFAAYLAANGNKYPYPANFANCTSITSCPSNATQCIGKIPASQMSFSGTGNTSGSSTTLTFTATAPGMGNLYVGMPLVGTGITAGTYVASIGTYNGTSGTVIMSAAMTVASETITYTQLPSWFAPNNWFDVIYYTAGTNALTTGGGGGGGGKSGKGKKRGGVGGGGSGGSGSTLCTATAATLSILDINGNPLPPNANALFLLPGVPLSSQTRTGSLSASPNNLPSYFEDAENLNLDSTYIMPGAVSNDSIYILP